MAHHDIPAQAVAVAAGADVPALLWGPPGCGKSSVVRQIAEASGAHIEVIVGSLRDPSDFAGLPVVHTTDAGPVTAYAIPDWVQRLQDDSVAYLMLDELTTAPPAVTAAMLRVVLERMVGDTALGPNVRIVAAANPAEQAVDGWDLAPPLANRFCHIDWPAEPTVVADGFVTGFDAPTVPTVPTDTLDAAEASSKSAVSAFLRRKPALVCAVPDDPVSAGRAWPSPRSWEMAARLHAAATAARVSDEVTIRLVAGCVGEGAASEWLMWMQEMDLPDPEALLADPKGVELPTRDDRLFAALNAAVAAVAHEPTPERAQACWTLLARFAAGDHADTAAVAAMSLARLNVPGAVPPADVLSFEPVLQQAGLLASA